MSDSDSNIAVYLNGDFEWLGTGFSIKDISLKIHKGETIAIVGSVGSGKSNLLNAIIGEMIPIQNNSTHSFAKLGSGRISYSPQKAFVLSGTIRDNIVLGAEGGFRSIPYQEQETRIKAAIDAACMQADIEQFPRGLDQEVGESGVTLSGGQQTRLSVARAFYRDPSILIVDDPLAAVDHRVGHHMFESFMNFTKISNDHTLVMALNQMQYLDQFDRIVVMDGCEIVNIGAYEDLMKDEDGLLPNLIKEAAGEGEYDDNMEDPNQNNDEETGNSTLHSVEQQDVWGNSYDNDFSEKDKQKQEGHISPSSAPKKSPVFSNASSPQRYSQSPRRMSDQIPAIPELSLADYSGRDSHHFDANQGSKHESTHYAEIVESSTKDDYGELDDLIHDESTVKGTVSFWVIKRYIVGMGKVNLFLCIFFGLTCYTVMALNDRWLALWLETDRSSDNDVEPVIPAPPGMDDTLFFIVIYLVGNLVFLFLLQATSWAFSRAGVCSSASLHHEVVSTVLHAKMSWFEEIPSGRIISRFSSDLSVVDLMLSRFVDNLWQFFCTLLALIALVAILVPPSLIVITIAIIAFAYLIIGVDRANREVKRMANLLMSPVQTGLSESFSGRSTIRVMQIENIFHMRFNRAMNAWSRQSFLSLAVMNAGMLSSYFISFVISATTAAYIVVERERIPPAVAGLALSYSILLPYFLLHFSFLLQITQSYLASLERLLDFAGTRGDGTMAIPQEPDWHLPSDPILNTSKANIGIENGKNQTLKHDKSISFVDPISKNGDDIESARNTEIDSWPKSGHLEFENVTLRYRKGLPPAVNRVSFVINHAEKVGICGTTGAGKSSLVLLMFRLVEATGGRILLDQRDISKLGIMTLRKAFSIVPQHPLLLRGTIRDNLDPFKEFDDERLAKVLAEVNFVQVQRQSLEENVDINTKKEKINQESDSIRSQENMSLSKTKSSWKSFANLSMNDRRVRLEQAKELLDLEVGADADMLSAGSKQLISLARTLLRPVKIVVADEPSSSLDAASDLEMRRVLQRRFDDTTVITIAHRLNTIVTGDKIIVMAHGKVVEIGKPLDLLQNNDSAFRKLADALGQDGLEKLRELAKKKKI